MQRRSFMKHASGPVVSALFDRATVDEYIASCTQASMDGADGMAIGIGALKPEFRNREDLERIITCVPRPFYVYFYRNDKWIPENNQDDDARQKFLMMAADAGSAMIDVMGDLYDPSPMEITRKPSAVRKQKKLIEKFHAKGVEVVISSHMKMFRSFEETLDHLQTLAERGADLVKIVTSIDTPEELAETLRTTVLLKKTMKIPFIHLCGGKYAKFHRFMCPTLGSFMSFATGGYPANANVPQPRVLDLKKVIETIDQAAGPLEF